MNMIPFVKEIVIYPIKSLSGIKLSQAICTERGLYGDRRYMLVDAGGHFISQREYPELSQFKTSLSENGILVEYKDDKLSFGDSNVLTNKKVSKIWSHDFESLLMDNFINDWFSLHLGFQCYLVHMNEDVKRIKTLSKGPKTTELSYADGYPYLLLGTKSTEYLNQKLKEPITHDRFRANIILETDIPHEEDDWDHIDIGKSKFRVIKPCARCQVINIDQKTSIKSKDPLKTLSNYRKVGNKINFGANAINTSTGSTIKVGDTIKIT